MTPSQISRAFGKAKLPKTKKSVVRPASTQQSKVKASVTSPRKGGCCGKRA
jgi:hypothetical protein